MQAPVRKWVMGSKRFEEFYCAKHRYANTSRTNQQSQFDATTRTRSQVIRTAVIASEAALQA